MGSTISIGPVAQGPPDTRTAFIRRVYLHLAGAIVLCGAIEAALLRLPVAETMVRTITPGYNWLIVLAAFIVISTAAQRWARSDTSRALQYLGLGVFVVAQAVVLLPILYSAYYYAAPSVIPTAGILTGALFLGLTGIAFTSGTDFSMLRGGVTVGMFLALGLIVASILFGFQLGLWFAAALIVLAAGAILAQTSAIMREYRGDQYVAAALGLFAAVALLFWNVLRLVERR